MQIAKRAKTQASLGGYDVVFLDTAGRLHIDEVLMDEVQAVRDIAQPRETLLVVDGLTGQDAVNVATEFDGKVGITGVVLTRMDGDGRGGAALSMRAVTGKPIRFVGLGEKMDALETFEADRVAGRILGMGDIVALVEKAQETFEAEQAERMMKRFQKGLFNMNDLKMQLDQMLKMGGMQGLMGMMPGMGKMQKAAAEAGFDDKMLRRQIALINSMTKKERANPDLLQASRKKRIAAGAGLDVSELNKLLKQHRQMADMMKKMGKGGMMKSRDEADDGQGRHARPVQDVARPAGRGRQGACRASCRIGPRRPGRHGARADAARRPVGADEEEMIPTLDHRPADPPRPPARGFRTLRGLLGLGAVGARGRPARPARRVGGFRSGLRPLGDRGLRHMVGRRSRDGRARRRDRLLPPRRFPGARDRLGRARRVRGPGARL